MQKTGGQVLTHSVKQIETARGMYVTQVDLTTLVDGEEVSQTILFFSYHAQTSYMIRIEQKVVDETLLPMVLDSLTFMWY